MYIVLVRVRAFFYMREIEEFVFQELASAGDLAQMIKHFSKHGRRLSEKTIWKFFCQITSGLEHMHSKRIMHRGNQLI